MKAWAGYKARWRILRFIAGFAYLLSDLFNTAGNLLYRFSSEIH